MKVMVRIEAFGRLPRCFNKYDRPVCQVKVIKTFIQLVLMKLGVKRPGNVLSKQTWSSVLNVMVKI